MKLNTKIKKQALLIFIAAFAISLIPQLLDMGLREALANLQAGSLEYSLQVTIYNIANLLITPVLAFVVFYFIGKQTNLSVELKWAILTLLLGNVSGYVIGAAIYEYDTGFPVGMIPFLSLPAFAYAFVGEAFFVELAALAVAYIRQCKKAPTPDALSSSDFDEKTSGG